MPRKAFSCNVDLDLYRVSCPGTLHLVDRNMVFINVSIFGQSVRTKSVFATFPLNFNERFQFQQNFTLVSEPSQVVELLEDEVVILELRQYSEYHKGGKLLGQYKHTAKEFLYPSPTLTGKNGMDREVLLSRSVHFTGIDPKLEFASRTTMQEVTLPGIDYEETNGYSSDVSENSSSESSETEEEVVVYPSIDTNQFSDVHCVCECPRRPENKGSVVSRSRSLSPTRRSKSVSPGRQPPFRAGTADKNIISRRNFPHSKKSQQRTPMPLEGDPLPCYNCKVPHKDCIVCQAYYKVFGRDFLRHRFTTTKHRGMTEAYTEPPRARSHRYFEKDTGPSYHERAYSAPIPRRIRLFTTPKATSSPYTSGSDARYSKYQPVRSRSHINLSDSDDDSLLSLRELRSEINSARLESLDRSFEDPEHPSLGTRLDRSLQGY